MTFDDDFIRVHLQGGLERNWVCKPLGLEWPPPQLLIIEGYLYNRIRYSQITDELREGMTSVARGAEYKFVPVAEAADRDKAVKIDPGEHIPTLAELGR